MDKKRYIGLEDLDEINRQNELLKKNSKKRKKEKRSIFEKFSTKENIIIFSFLLIFCIIGWQLINKYNPFDKVDYRKLTINDLLDNSTPDYNRENYWILNNILLEFLYSNSENTTSKNGEGSEANMYFNYNTEEYYEVLTNDYKKYLSKEKYLELSNNVITNFKENYKVLVNATNIAPIRKVYKCNIYSDNLYIVKLNTSNNSYVAIELFKDISKFKIFYME